MTNYDVEAVGKAGIAAVAMLSGEFAHEALREAEAVALYDVAARSSAALLWSLAISTFDGRAM